MDAVTQIILKPRFVPNYDGTYGRLEKVAEEHIDAWEALLEVEGGDLTEDDMERFAAMEDEELDQLMARYELRPCYRFGSLFFDNQVYLMIRDLSGEKHLVRLEDVARPGELSDREWKKEYDMLPVSQEQTSVFRLKYYLDLLSLLRRAGYEINEISRIFVGSEEDAQYEFEKMK